MVTEQLKPNREQIQMRALIPFISLTFLIAWGILALYIFLPEPMTSIFGAISGNHPLFYLAVYAPAIAAFSIVITRAEITGLGHFLRGFLIWRSSIFWYAFLLIGMPVVFYAGAGLNGNLFTEPFPFASFQAVLPALILSAIKGPVEEFGWRGFALPLLQRKLTPVVAALLLGVIWGTWHLPAFLLSGTQQSSWAFLPFFTGTIAISVIMTALFNESKGSILLAAVMHYQLMNPIWPDAQPYDTYILTIVAVLLIVFKHRMFFTKEHSVSEIIRWK